MNCNTDVIVIGAGAAGLAAAVKAGERGKHVLLLEKAERPGRKIYASGNGRCNLMNSGRPRYYGDPEFAASILRRCSNDELKSFFQHYGLHLTEEDEGRIYPFSFQSSSVVSTLKNALAITGVTLIVNEEVLNVCHNKGLFKVNVKSGDTYSADRLIIACGGAAQPKLGGNTDGYRMLTSLGHSLIPIKPSLVPFITEPKCIAGLSGIRIRCSITLFSDNNQIHEENGEVLFTDYGISGICIMQCARFAGKGLTFLQLNLLKDAFESKDSCLKELRRRKTLFSNLSPLCLLNGILPERMAFAVLKQADVPLRGETAGKTSDKLLQRIVDVGFAYRINITGNRGFEYAQVTAGGIECSEFNPSTLESRILPGLYAAGEVLNVDGDCGGFNLMFAFACGLIAGSAV